MFHAMKFAMYAEDGSAVLPVTKLWFHAKAPFTSALSTAVSSRAPKVTYNGTETTMAGYGSSQFYHNCTIGSGTVEVVVEDALESVGLSAPAFSSYQKPDLATRLLSVDAIGAAVTKLNDQAFYGCTRLGPVFEPQYYGAGLELGASCFEGCYAIREFSRTFLSRVTSAGAGVFAGCTSLATIDGMAAFDPAEDRSFYRCSSLQSLEGGFSAATRLGEECFYGCSSLQSLSGIPPTLAELGAGCFARCYALTDISQLGTAPALTALPDRCFFYCTGITSVSCGDTSAITSFGASCFEKCGSLEVLDGAPPALETVGDKCFSYTGLRTITGMPQTVVELGEECFRGCEFLATVEGIPPALEAIGDGCFRDCHSEDHPEDPERPDRESSEHGLSDISAFAAAATREVQTANAGTVRVANIPARCFAGDRMIRTLPDFTAVDFLTVGPYAFSDCSGLDSLEGLPANTTFLEGAFSGCFRDSYDWWVYIGDHWNPPYGVKTMWAGLRSADMSHLTTTALPDRCFENCGALPDLPPLPPKLLKMGSRCFAGCTGLTSLDSIGDLDIEIVDGSTHYGNGNPRAPVYPSFGDYCFAGCGLGIDRSEATYYNDPDNPPETGSLGGIGGLTRLCDALQYQAVAKMSASSTAIMSELFRFFTGNLMSSLGHICDADLWTMFRDNYGDFWDLESTDLLLYAGMVENMSKAAIHGFTVFYEKIVEKLPDELEAAPEWLEPGKRHDVLAIFMANPDDPTKHRLWVCCPGFDAELDISIESESEGYQTVQTVSAEGVTAQFTVIVYAGTISHIEVQFYRGSASQVICETKLVRAEYTAPGTAEARAGTFMKLMAFALTGQQMRSLPRDKDSAYLSDTISVLQVITHIIRHIDDKKALGTLRDLNLVTPASTMLGAHCFDGCVHLNLGYSGGFPTLISDVPPYSFANTKVAALNGFSHVGTIGTGAFMNTSVGSLAGYPSRLTYITSKTFQGCKGLGALSHLHRYVMSFGASTFAGCTGLSHVRCETGDSWWGGPAGIDYRQMGDELLRVAGYEYSLDLPHWGDPPITAFIAARPVTSFGSSCFMGCTSLTGDSFMTELTVPDKARLLSLVRAKVSTFDIYKPYANSFTSMTFSLAFELASDVTLMVRITEGGQTANEESDIPVIDSEGNPLDVMAAVITGASAQTHVGTMESRNDAGEIEERLATVGVWSSGKYFGSESGDAAAVMPSRRRLTDPSNWSFVRVEGGYLVLYFDVYGHRFRATYSFSVNRESDPDRDYILKSVRLAKAGVYVEYVGDPWVGYPDLEQTLKYSAVPLLTDVGSSCFEGCTGLDHLDWVPFGVTQFPARCFAGVPFTHDVEDPEIPVPNFVSWSSPTYDVYNKVVYDLCHFDPISFGTTEDSDGNDTTLVIDTRDGSGVEYIRFTVTTTTDADGNRIPVLHTDPDHMQTGYFEYDRSIRTMYRPSGFVDLGSTKGFSGNVRVVSVQDNTATLQFGDLTMLLTVTDNYSKYGDRYPVSLDAELSYVSCPTIDAMESAIRNLAGTRGTMDTAAPTGPTWMLARDDTDVLGLIMSTTDGTWSSVYKTFTFTVDTGHVFSFARAPWSQALINDSESLGEYWFRAEVPGDTSIGEMYVYARIENVHPVALIANSVTVPAWVDSIGRNCFTFDNYQDAAAKLEALYIHGSPTKIRNMSGFPWGVPPGCTIYSTTGGAVYSA